MLMKRRDRAFNAVLDHAIHTSEATTGRRRQNRPQFGVGSAHSARIPLCLEPALAVTDLLVCQASQIQKTSIDGISYRPIRVNCELPFPFGRISLMHQDYFLPEAVTSLIHESDHPPIIAFPAAALGYGRKVPLNAGTGFLVPIDHLVHVAFAGGGRQRQQGHDKKDESWNPKHLCSGGEPTSPPPHSSAASQSH